MSYKLIYKKGLMAMSVCVHKSMTREAIEEWANQENPTGIESRWKIAKTKVFIDGSPNPCKCQIDLNQLHWLLEC